MTMFSVRSIVPLCLMMMSIVPINAGAQQNKESSDELFRTIAAQDKALFDSYNTCDLNKFKSFLEDDVEFYHDQGGLSTGSQTITDQVKANICGKARREIVEGTLEVYPMHGYGAVEIGVHRFYQPQSGNKPTGEAKFIHLWRNKDGVWKLSRIISYDHEPLMK